MSNPKELPPTLRRCARVIRMVHELHKLGFQRLRVMPYLGSTNCWRLVVVPASQVSVTHGAWSDDCEPAARYTAATGNEYFGWRDAAADTAADLARKFVERFADLCRAGYGRDWCYAGWYLELMAFADRGELPCVLADGMPPADPRFLPTLEYLDSGLPMPPGGESCREDLRPPECRRLDPAAPVRTVLFNQNELVAWLKIPE